MALINIEFCLKKINLQGGIIEYIVLKKIKLTILESGKRHIVSFITASLHEIQEENTNSIYSMYVEMFQEQHNVI